MLDASGSIIYKHANSTANYDNWNLMKAFVVTLIRGLGVSHNDTRVSLVLFSHESSVIFKLDSYFTTEMAIQVTFTLVHFACLIISIMMSWMELGIN